MVDPPEQLEDMASGIHHQLLADARSVPSPIRQLCRTLLEHDSVIHRIEMICTFLLKTPMNKLR